MSTEATTTKVNTLLSSPQLSAVKKPQDENSSEQEQGKPVPKSTSSKAGLKMGLIPLGLAAAGLVLFLTRPKTYVVKKGDTLSSLAKRQSGGNNKKLGKNLKKLQKKNPNIQNKDLIYTSQKIKV